jgi:hypothetical protein
MTGYERFMIALLRKGEPDRVPLWELIINEPTLSAWGAKSLEEFVEMEDLDGITIFEDMKLEPLGTAEQKELVWRGRTILTGTRQVVRDEWGIIWASLTSESLTPLTVPSKSRQTSKLTRHLTRKHPTGFNRFGRLSKSSKVAGQSSF